MFLCAGDPMFIAHRRLFEHDHPRAFVGEVLAYECGLVELSGYSRVRESVHGRLETKEDRRNKAASMNSVSVICHQLPDIVNIEEPELVAGRQQKVTLTDHKDFRMDLADRSGAIRSVSEYHVGN